jgi:hypothetical protein
MQKKIKVTKANQNQNFIEIKIVQPHNLLCLECLLSCVHKMPYFFCFQ